MKKNKRLQTDLNHLNTSLLLIFSVLAASTGIWAELEDINDFIYHKYSAYVMALLLCLHVCYHWTLFTGYFRFRWKKWKSLPKMDPPETSIESPSEKEGEKIVEREKTFFQRILSRRGFLGFCLGGAGGVAMGYNLSPETSLYGGDLGLIYHEWSKPKFSQHLGALASWGFRPDQYKGYPEKKESLLPAPDSMKFPSLSVEESIHKRMSHRTYSGVPVNLPELSHFLYYTGGIHSERWGIKRRAYPSSGALYGIEMYIAAFSVDGLESGLYHYGVEKHSLRLLKTGNFRKEMTENGLEQEFIGQSNFVVILTAILQRMKWKYKTRAYRYCLIEAGHIGQNIYLMATSMGMGTCEVGAFYDDALNRFLGIDGEEEMAMNLFPVGKIL